MSSASLQKVSGVTFWGDSLHITHNACPVTPLTIGFTVLKVVDDLDILAVTFYSKITFEKLLRSASRACGNPGENSL